MALLNKNLEAKSVSCCGALRSGLATLQLTFERSDFLSHAKYSIKNPSGDGGGAGSPDGEGDRGSPTPEAWLSYYFYTHSLF